MKRFVTGQARGQATLFPKRLEDFIAEDNPVRVIDAFVEELDLRELGFKRVDPLATGRPAYHPAVLLKLYIYGYLNRVQSSRRLERETQRNVETMWLTGRLTPDFKTIADFRRDNGKAIRRVCRDFVLLCRHLNLFSQANEYRCPGGERLTWRFRSVEAGRNLDTYWSSACPGCDLKGQCTTGKQRRIRRWEHEDVLEAVQARLDARPESMRLRRLTVEHPFGTIKSWMGYTHFLTKTLPRVRTEMSLHVLAYNLKRVMNTLGIGPLLAAMRA